MSENPIGRPSLYKPEYCQKIIELAEKGEYLPVFWAVSLGVHKDTLHEWCSKYPDFSDSYRRAKCIGEAFCAKNVVLACEREINPRGYERTLISCFNWGEKKEVEHSGSIKVTEVVEFGERE